MAAGNRHIGLKEMLNQLETTSPGTKAAFVSGFWSRGHDAFVSKANDERATLQPCVECGAPTTTGDRCAFCSLRARAAIARTDPPPNVAPSNVALASHPVTLRTGS